jgi:cytochrome c oxidase subunit 2
MRIPIWFEAGATGNYEIACAQLCGNNHYSMRAVMVVENPTDFDKWAEEKSAPPEFFEDF